MADGQSSGNDRNSRQKAQVSSLCLCIVENEVRIIFKKKKFRLVKWICARCIIHALWFIDFPSKFCFFHHFSAHVPFPSIFNIDHRLSLLECCISSSNCLYESMSSESLCHCR